MGVRRHPVLRGLKRRHHGQFCIAQEGSNQRRHKSLIAQWKAELNQPKEVDIKDRPFRGAADAPVTIVAYSDFTCPYCQQAAGTMEKVLKENQGKIKYVFKHFPLETTGVARLAAEYHVAAARQDPELAWKFYDLLFARRADVLKDGEPAIVNAAKDAGLNMKKLAADVEANLNPAKWVCVEAEKTAVLVHNCTVLLVMSWSDVTDALTANFNALWS